MRVADAATVQGDGANNQDCYVIGDYYAAVLDGASAYPPQPEGRDGGWYATQLAQAIDSAITREKALDLVLMEAIDTVSSTAGLTPGESPSSTVALTRWDGSHVECLVLGDSTIVVGHTDGTVETITDSRLASVAAPQRQAYRRRLITGTGFDEEHRRLLHVLQIEQRRARNTKNGYWIAEADTSAAFNALERRYPQRQVADLVLMTDGAACIVETMELVDWQAVASIARAAGCAEILRMVTAAEDEDPYGEQFPRSKRHDDKTALLVTG